MANKENLTTLFEDARVASKSRGRIVFKKDSELSSKIAKLSIPDAAVFLEYVCENSTGDDGKARRVVFETVINVLNAREVLVECVSWGRYTSTMQLLDAGIADEPVADIMKDRRPDLKFILHLAETSREGSRTALVTYCVHNGICTGKFGVDLKSWAYSWGITKLLFLDSLAHSMLIMQGNDVTPYSYLRIFLTKGPVAAVKKVLESGDYVYTFNSSNPLNNSERAIESVLEVFEEITSEKLHPTVKRLIPELMQIFTILESADHIGIALSDKRDVHVNVKIGAARQNASKVGNPGYSNVFKKFLHPNAQKAVMGTPDVVSESKGSRSLPAKTWEEFTVASAGAAKSLESVAASVKKRSPFEYAKFMRASRMIDLVSKATGFGVKQPEWKRLDPEEKADLVGERIDPVLIAAYRSDPEAFNLAVEILNREAETPAGPISAKGIVEESEDTDMNRIRNLKYAVSNEIPAAVLDNWATIADSVAPSLPSSSHQKSANVQAENARKIAVSLRNGTVESQEKLTLMINSFVPDFHEPSSVFHALPIECREHGKRNNLYGTVAVGDPLLDAIEMEGGNVKKRHVKSKGKGDVGVFIPTF